MRFIGTITAGQETLASVLGVRREDVTLAAGKLQKTGLIRYQRGRIAIVDRARMEALACQCYREIRDEYARLFAGHPR
jgi:Mn-dependent DtxR family transcriptional regulator